MTAPTVRTTSTSTARASRLAMLVALVVTSIGALGASSFVAAPAGAAASTVAMFRGETLAMGADPAPGGSLNKLRATVVVAHDPGVTITGVKTSRNGNVSGSFGTSNYTVRTMSGSSTTHSIVEIAFEPGTGNWPGFKSTWAWDVVRQYTFNACVQVNTSNGATDQQCWNYKTSSSTNDSYGNNDHMVVEQNYGTAQGDVFTSSPATFPVEYMCDDADTTGNNGTCDQMQLRLRNVGTGATVALRCDQHRTGGAGCETRSGAPAGAWNADDNTRRDHTLAVHGLGRGKWVIEGLAGDADNNYGGFDWQWLGWIYVNPTAPTLALTSPGTDTRPDGSFHPNTGAGITYTADVSGDGQILDWDADLDTGNGLESRERAAMDYSNNAGGVPSFTLGQRQRTIVAGGSGVPCGVRAQLRDSGSLAATSDGHSQVTGIVDASCVTNRIPTGEHKAIAAHQGTPVPINLSTTDGDGDPTSCHVVSAPTKGQLSPGTGCSRAYTPNNGPNGTDTFTYQVKDDHNGTSATYTVTININNQAPVANAQDIVVYAGEPTTLTMTGSDPDGDALTSCAVTTAPTKGTVSTGTGCSRTYTSGSDGPNQGKGGSDQVGFTVSDGNVASAPAPIDITIHNPDLSVTKASSGRFNEGVGTGSYTITVSNSAAAPAHGPTIVTDTLPTGMTFRSADVGTSAFACSAAVGDTTVTCTRTSVIPPDSSVQLELVVDVATGTPTPSVNSVEVTNPYELATTAADNTGTDSTAINRPPSIADSTVGTAVDTPVAITFSGIDPNGDELTYQVTSAAHGSLSGTGATRTYTPNAGFEGVDTFSVQVTDTGTPGLSATATVTVWVGVRPVNGTVTSEQTGLPLEGIQVWLVDNADPVNPVIDQIITTGANGTYDFGAVPFGTYAIRYHDTSQTYISEFHLNARNRQEGTDTVLTAGTTAVVRDAALTAGAIISGTVRSEAPGHAAADAIQVRLVRAGQSGGSARDTDAAGAYEYRLLTAGTYQVWFRDMTPDRFHSEWFTGSADQAGASTITVVAGQTVTVDELLTPVAPPPPPDSGVISGTVRSAGPGNAPVAGIQVRAYREPYAGSTATTTDANGEYSFTRLPPGNWKIWFRDVAGTNHISQYNGNALTLDDSDAIAVNNDTKVIDVQLAPKATVVTPQLGTITGTVTETDGVTPVAGLQVRIYVAGQSGSRAATTDANGVYTFTKVTPGSYQVWFRDLGRTWVSEWNLDKPNQATAEPVAAVAGEVTTVLAQLARR